MKNNPNEFKPGDVAILDETFNNRCNVVIHEITESEILAVVGLPGAPKEHWRVVQIRRLSILKTKNHESN